MSEVAEPPSDLRVEQGIPVSPKPPISRIKRIFFSTIGLLIAWSLVELAAWAVFPLVKKDGYSKVAIRSQLKSVLALSESTSKDKKDGEEFVLSGIHEVLHPYFGYVVDPARHKDVSDQGFWTYGVSNTFLKRSPDRLIVGIFGGSFAQGITFWSAPTLSNALATTGRQVHLLNFASGGYKQPQQMLILAYMLGQGAEFDIVLNVDGFNEVALPVADNVAGKSNPFYPRVWQMRVGGLMNADQLRCLGTITFIQERRLTFARIMLSLKLYRSPLASLVWKVLDDRKSSALYAVRRELQSSGNARRGMLVSGPAYSAPNEDRLYRDLVETWAGCSRQMNYLCAANGISYLHFLQPNQYYENSKPLSATERSRAIEENSPYGATVKPGYPLLRESGRGLASEGVNFTDLTLLFANNHDDLYIDSCCHVGKQGCDLVVKKICDRIFETRKF